MPKNFRRLIIIERKRCRMRKHTSGKNSTTYEIRFRRDGYDVSASGVTIKLAKQNFIEKLKTAKPKEKKKSAGSSFPTTFTSFSIYYFETFRKNKIAELTYKNDSLRLKNHLQPYFGEKPIDKITPSDCKTLLDSLNQQGKYRTAEEIRSLLSVILKGAIAHGIIERNPLNIVPVEKHERESGTALTREEEKILFERLNEPNLTIATALALFCGLRPNELKTAKIRGNFIIAVNSKRKHQKIEYKRIPIIDKLRPFLKNGIPTLPTLTSLRNQIKKILPNHRLYDLRTTFYTRCKELGIADAARDHFVGHSLGTLGNTYTDLSDEYLLKEGMKLNKW